MDPCPRRRSSRAAWESAHTHTHMHTPQCAALGYSRHKSRRAHDAPRQCSRHCLRSKLSNAQLSRQARRGIARGSLVHPHTGNARHTMESSPLPSTWTATDQNATQGVPFLPRKGRCVRVRARAPAPFCITVFSFVSRMWVRRRPRACPCSGVVVWVGGRVVVWVELLHSAARTACLDGPSVTPPPPTRHTSHC